MHPPLEPLQELARVLQTAGIDCALGGSGLLYSLGLTDVVHDWDLTTDATLREIAAALERTSVRYAAKPHGDGPFDTHFRIAFLEPYTDIELLGRFAIRTEAGVCHLPALGSRDWNGVQVGSPEVWYAAYALMNRPPKAELLLGYLQEQGAEEAVLRRLLDEPLPQNLRDTLLQLVEANRTSKQTPAELES